MMKLAHVTRTARATLLLLPLLLCSCSVLPLAPAPLRSIDYTDPSQVSSTLLVLLPGIWDSAADFDKHGWIASINARDLPVDVIAADVHIGYYLTGNVVERLRRDIVLPARRHGYRSIWLVGISLGGLGSLLYAHAHPHDVDGVLLISPYLPRPGARFDPAIWLAHENGQDGLWEWLFEGAPGSATQFPVLLAYGANDRLAEANRRLARVLGPGNVLQLPGTHEWGTWNRLWEESLGGRAFTSATPWPPVGVKQTGRFDVSVTPSKWRLRRAP